MKKENLIAQLEGVKALTSVVSIDNVIALIQQLEPEIVVETKLGITQELAEEIADKIERCLDYNSDDFVDTSSAEFELDYNNTIRLDRVDVDTRAIMEHVTSALDEFVVEEAEEGILTDVVELERGDNPHDTAYEATLEE
jgi:hypothetical protein